MRGCYVARRTLPQERRRPLPSSRIDLCAPGGSLVGETTLEGARAHGESPRGYRQREGRAIEVGEKNISNGRGPRAAFPRCVGRAPRMELLRVPGKLGEISESQLQQGSDDSVPVPAPLRSNRFPRVARELAQREVRAALGDELAQGIEHASLGSPARQTRLRRHLPNDIRLPPCQVKLRQPPPGSNLGQQSR